MSEETRFAAKLDQPALSVGEDGAICDCDEALEGLLQYRSGELTGQHVSVVLPELRKGEFIRDGKVNPPLLFLCHIGHRFRLMTRDHQCIYRQIFLNALHGSGCRRIRIIVRLA